MEQQPIHFLTPYQPANKLQIKVCRMWTTKSIEDNPQPISLDCVFVDKRCKTFTPFYLPFNASILSYLECAHHILNTTNI